MADLKGKKIIITGASSGIGRASAKLAVQRGASVLAVDIDPNTAATADELNGAIAFMQVDVSKEEQVAAMAERCVRTFGGIDGIFANAGIDAGGVPFLEQTAEHWQRILAINTIGVFLCIKHTAPYLTKQAYGSIVCTASVAGLRANAGAVSYSASKAGVISIVQTTSYHLYGTGVRVSAVCPGLIETNMTQRMFDKLRGLGKEARIGLINPTKRHGQPSEIAEMACFLLSDAASYVNGQAIAIDGGLSASHPWAYPRG